MQVAPTSSGGRPRKYHTKEEKQRANTELQKRKRELMTPEEIDGHNLKRRQYYAKRKKLNEDNEVFQHQLAQSQQHIQELTNRSMSSR